MRRQLKDEDLAGIRPADSSVAAATVYGAAFLIAEFAMAFLNTVAGVVAHAIILLVAVQVGIYIEANRSWREDRTRDPLMLFLLCWPLADLSRIAAVGLPLRSLPFEIRPGIFALVLGVAVVAALRASDLSWEDLGSRFNALGPEALMAAAGLPLGSLAFTLAPRAPLGPSRGSVAFVVSAALVACVGASEEILFRGLLQRATVGLFGWIGVPFTAVLSAATLLTERSFWLVLYALVVSLFFGAWVYQRRSLVGVVVAHGLMAATMAVIWPRIL
jgi:membrane protease YdiL (CAAX protease family)